MVLISFTNIVVDEFSYGKRNPLKKYIYFLTHMHSDHYQGITPNWNFGTIYCSEVTKKLLLNKFPQLQDVRTLEMNKSEKICLNAENNIEINVYLFDANHCPGSVMYMFEGYFGRILHTGDMRFNENLIYNNPVLFPIEKRNKELKKCSIQIDECIFDNTYCDPIFKFPRREKACQMLVEIIEKHKHIPNVRFVLCVDSVGKEELLVFLSQHFETLIVVNEQRYQSILCMDIPYQLFTTNRDQGWIEVIRKNEKQERMESKTEHCISITCTGWANIQGYITKDERNYLLPYSLHSNFEELELFIRSIYPSVLNTVVRNTSKGVKINNITQFSAYMITLMNLKQRGVEFFQKNYIDFTTISKNYQSLMMNSDNTLKINKALGLELTEKDKLVEDTIDFQSKHAQIFKNKKRLKKGAQLSHPQENSSFSIDKFIEIKKNIEIMKEQKQKSQESSAKSSKKNSLMRKQYYDNEEDEEEQEVQEFDNQWLENYDYEKVKQNSVRKDNQKPKTHQELESDQNDIYKKMDLIKQKLNQHLVLQNEQIEDDIDNNNFQNEDENQQNEADEFKNQTEEDLQDDNLQDEGNHFKIQNNDDNNEQQQQQQQQQQEQQQQQNEQNFENVITEQVQSQSNKNLSKYKFRKIVRVSTQQQVKQEIAQEQISVKSQNGMVFTGECNSGSMNKCDSLGGIIKKKQITIKVSKKHSIDAFDMKSNDDKEQANSNPLNQDKLPLSSNQQQVLSIPLNSKQQLNISQNEELNHISFLNGFEERRDNQIDDQEKQGNNLNQEEKQKQKSISVKKTKDIPVFRNPSLNKIFNQYLNKQ